MQETAIKPRWELGNIVATPDAITRMNSGGLSAMEILARHSACDFSECDPEDAKSNLQALQDGSRVFNVFKTNLAETLWVITESADEAGRRYSTCILCPENY